MAKKDKKVKAKAEEKETKAQEREYEYGVEDIAEELDIKPASVRVQLRNKGIEKAGKAYGWSSKKELKEVIAQLRSGKDDDEDEDEKPAKKSKKPAKAAAKKRRAKDEDDD